MIATLLSGTCTEAVVCDEAEACEVTNALLLETVLKSGTELLDYRMDDDHWSKLTRGATLSSSYFVYFPDNYIWWFIGFAGHY